MKALRNVIPIGRLDYGIFPEDGREPVIYMYYRDDGNCYLYRTKDKIEINLSKISSYDNVVFFKYTLLPTVSELDITEFDARTIEASKSHYHHTIVQPPGEFAYILIPAIYDIQAIYLNDVISTTLFSYQSIYEHDGLYYFCYKSNNTLTSLTPLDLNVILRKLSTEDYSVILQHLSDYNDPHKTLDYIKKVEGLFELLWKEDGVENISLREVNVIRGTSQYIENYPIKDKQILLDRQRGRLFIDEEYERRLYGSGGTGGGLEIVNNANADDLTEEGIYICIGNKFNFPTTPHDINIASYKFLLFVEIRNDLIVQTIFSQGGNIYRIQDPNSVLIPTFQPWIEELISNKQNKVDTNLQTAAKDVVGAINELQDRLNGIHMQGVTSTTIKHIELVEEYPAIMLEDTLYGKFIQYEDGINNMEITPPFRVRSSNLTEE